ncbi:MAG: hypothetical protein CFE21_21325 [Bacteroidetes bacterium B1(2017)]|nr:MAG: hypothetical protein CFE21_21325 [Bacteroidetes bacterium B1(2017)]
MVIEMKKINFLYFVIFGLLTSSCVQESYNQTVTVILDVSGIKDIKSVGLRGDGKPLSWDEDFEMKPLIKDSLYTTTFSGKTGYLFAEVKFVVNGEFELKDKDNRQVYFDKSRKTIYKATFNKND